MNINNADHIKKGVFHRHGIDKDKLVKELGDNLWYIVALCTKLGVTLEEVMRLNIDKLRKRYPDGYSSAASQIRVDVVPNGDKAFADALLRMMDPDEVPTH